MGCMIKSPKQFAEYADSIIENIQVLYFLTNKLALQDHTECRDNSAYVYGTLKVHAVDCFVLEDKMVLKFYMTSISSDTINVKYFNNINKTINKSQVLIIKKGKVVDRTSSGNQVIGTRKQPTNKTFDVGEYCLVRFEGELWPGQITKINSPGSVQVNAMKKQKHRYTLPGDGQKKLVNWTMLMFS